MQDLVFPINFTFRITTLSNDFTAVDGHGRTIAYVKQKLFKLKEDIIIYSDDRKDYINYRIKADKWLDFSTAYTFYDTDGREMGKVARKGWASLWRASYDIIDRHGQIKYKISEENAWAKVMDSVIGEIPVLGALSGYIFNPKYQVVTMMNETVFRLKKEPSFWGRRFTVDKVVSRRIDDDEIIMLALMMMILLERRRG